MYQAIVFLPLIGALIAGLFGRVIVMALVDDGRILVDLVGRMGVAMTVVVMMLDRIARGVAGMRAEQRDQAGEDGAEQRQKNDCLDHSRVNPSSD